MASKLHLDILQHQTLAILVDSKPRQAILPVQAPLEIMGAFKLPLATHPLLILVTVEVSKLLPATPQVLCLEESSGALKLPLGILLVPTLAHRSLHLPEPLPLVPTLRAIQVHFLTLEELLILGLQLEPVSTRVADQTTKQHLLAPRMGQLLQQIFNHPQQPQISFQTMEVVRLFNKWPLQFSKNHPEQETLTQPDHKLHPMQSRTPTPIPLDPKVQPMQFRIPILILLCPKLHQTQSRIPTPTPPDPKELLMLSRTLTHIPLVPKVRQMLFRIPTPILLDPKVRPMPFRILIHTQLDLKVQLTSCKAQIPTRPDPKELDLSQRDLIQIPMLAVLLILPLAMPFKVATLGRL